MQAIIETLNRLGAQAAEVAWPMLWQSSLLISMMFLADWALRRRVRAAVRYALWWLVLPPSLALPTSPSWWLRSSRPALAPTATAVVSFGPGGMAPVVHASPDRVFAPPPERLSVAGAAVAGAGSATLVLLLWILVRWRNAARLVRGSAHPPVWLKAIVEENRRNLGLRRPVRLGLVDRPISPAVLGLFRPVILVPEALVVQLSPAQLRTVLLHELIHLRRADTWANCFRALLQAAYWWHPLLWLANARMRRLREEAVDDAVMAGPGVEVEAYASALLQVAKAALQRPLATLALVGILESRSFLRQRIERLLDMRSPRIAGLSFASVLAVLAVGAVALPMGQPEPKPLSGAAPGLPRVATTSSALSGERSTTAAASRLPPDMAHLYNTLFLGPGRKTVLDVLDRIRVSVSFDKVPLGEVVDQLTEVVRNQRPEPGGLHFKILTNALESSGSTVAAASNPANVLISIKPEMRDVTLLSVVEAIVRSAHPSLRWSLLENGVAFSARRQDEPPNDLSIGRGHVNIKAALYKFSEESLAAFWTNQAITNAAGTNAVSLTPSQQRRALEYISSSPGVELLNEASVTTSSGRQTMIQLVDRMIVFTNINRRAFSYPGVPASGEGTNALYLLYTRPLGPTLDLLPNILADGLTVQLGAVATVFESVDYDGYTNSGVVFVAGRKQQFELPAPRFHTDCESATAVLRDGQTLVLKGLTAENVIKYKDKVPMLGDLPMVGRLFRNESTKREKKHMLVMITPTLVDPTGNRLHTDEQVEKAPAIQR